MIDNRFFFQIPVLIGSYNNSINYTGLSLTTLSDNIYPDFGKDYTSGNIDVTFSSAFGVLFCGVTGILAGANMSGKLKIYLCLLYIF